MMVSLLEPINFLHTWIIALLFSSFLLTPVSSSKHLKVTLNTNWNQTSILAEISELLAAESEEKYRKFIESIIQNEYTEFNGWSDERKYGYGMNLAAQLLNKKELDFLTLSLGLRKMSPLVELHQNLALEALKGSEPDCSAFFVYRDQKGCYLSDLSLTEGGSKNSERTFYFDHVFPTNTLENSDFFTIYGELGSPELGKLLKEAQILVESKNPRTKYVLRHYKRKPSDYYVSLSGYGVELSLKNNDKKVHYKPKYYDYQSTENETVEKVEEVPIKNPYGFNIKDLLEEHRALNRNPFSLRDHLVEIDTVTPLEEWQLRNLSLQISQYFLEKSLYGARNALEEMKEISQDFPVYASTLANITIDEDFEKNLKEIENLKEKGIKPGSNYLMLNGKKLDIGDGEQLDLYEFVETIQKEYALAERMAKIEWNNQRDFIPLLTQVQYPNGLPTVSLDYRHFKPLFINNMEEPRRGRSKSMRDYLQEFAPRVIRPIAQNVFTMVVVVNPFEQPNRYILDFVDEIMTKDMYIRVGWLFTYNREENGQSSSQLEELLNNNKTIRDRYYLKGKIDSSMENGNAFLNSTGLYKSPHVLLNGYLIDLVDKKRALEDKVWDIIDVQTKSIQKAVHFGEITNIQAWHFEKNEHVVKKAHYQTLDAFKSKKFVDFFNAERQNLEDLKNLKYYQNGVRHPMVTTWVVVDVENVNGRKMVYEALKSKAASGENNTLAIVLNPAVLPLECNSLNSTAFFASMIESEPLCNWFEVLNSVNFTNTVWNSTDTKAKKLMNSYRRSGSEEPCSVIRRHKNNFVKELFGIEKGRSAVISNGLIVGPFEENEPFERIDFDFLDTLWKRNNIDKVSEMLRTHEEYDHLDSLTLMKLYSEAITNDVGSRFHLAIDEFRNVVSVPPRSFEIPLLSVTWIANPATHEAQQLFSLVELMSDVANADIEILLNPAANLDEIPVKRFYRYSANKELKFDDNGNVQDTVVTINNLPRNELLTMSLRTNDAWMIELKEAAYDVDNIMFGRKNEDIEAVYSLEYIIVEGQCIDQILDSTESVQLELISGNKLFDTVVMQSSGYYQLKANPGVWEMRLKYGESLFGFEFAKLDDTYLKEKETPIILIDSFSPKWKSVELREYENEEREENLSERETFISTTSVNMLKGSEKPAAIKTSSINVFSMATGHLYERFLRIMMMSVVKNTKSKVKFWLLKDFLSPQLKESISFLAEKYGFDYTFVEYKWPKWLQRQNERRRVMSGYKILFLDVLFPVDLDKIIYIDADQVVRTDMLDLMNFNLEDAPYGFAPFCETRKDMEEHQFWKQGQWADHLYPGEKFHTSALYVVDLKEFREIMAGDAIRKTYATLAENGKNLANMDQDIPNGLKDSVPIATLPDNWLWCETWCNHEDKKKSKVIDLCYDPTSDESKFMAAVRIIREWRVLDNDIRELLKEHRTEKSAWWMHKKHEEL